MTRQTAENELLSAWCTSLKTAKLKDSRVLSTQRIVAIGNKWDPSTGYWVVLRMPHSLLQCWVAELSRQRTYKVIYLITEFRGKEQINIWGLDKIKGTLEIMYIYSFLIIALDHLLPSVQLQSFLEWARTSFEHNFMPSFLKNLL
jgi:hypothetical protein